MCGIDACSIPQEVASWSNLVWFQCPWTIEYPIHDLILEVHHITVLLVLLYVLV